MNVLSLAINDPALFVKKVAGRFARLYRQHILKDEFSLEAARWVRDHGDQTLRLDYPHLDENSVVFDLGGYVGDFAAEIFDKYRCTIYLFEPHPAFYEKCVHRFKDNDKIIPLNYGVSDVAGNFSLSDSVDGSSFLTENHKNKGSVTCEVREFFSVLSDLGVSQIDLM